MLARVHTFSLEGLDSRPVTVEVDIRQGLPTFVIVGLGDAAVREARERVRAALLNSGFEFPLRRIVANLAPAHARKVGSGFDLAIACGILAASGQVPARRLDELAVFGELSLTGSVRGCRGTLAVAQAARAGGLSGLLVAGARRREAALVDGLDVLGVADLPSAAAVLRGEDAAAGDERADELAAAGWDEPDLRDVRGHPAAIAALRVAAAGGHNVLLSGPPGTGKTMLARRVPSILPPLAREEAIEVTRIHSVAGRHAGDGLMASRPFRAPHHTISASGLVGGGATPALGEATLAHHGVLFLDELSEFSRLSLDALRQPLEDGRVTIVRGQRSAVFPTRFMLVAATNPCPCGFAGDPGRCTCGETDRARHARRLSGPLLDRMDVLVDVQRPTAAALAGEPVTDSATLRESVMAARELQSARLAGSGVACNAHMSAALVRRHARPDTEGRAVLAQAYARTRLSARGHERVLKLARTFADLAGETTVGAEHVNAAIGLRQERTLATGAAA